MNHYDSNQKIIDWIWPLWDKFGHYQDCCTMDEVTITSVKTFDTGRPNLGGISFTGFLPPGKFLVI